MEIHTMNELPATTGTAGNDYSALVLVLIEQGGERQWELARFIKECREFAPWDRWEEHGYGTILYPLAWTDLPPTELE